MKNISGTYIDKNYYIFDYGNQVVKDLEDLIDIDFTKRFMTTGEIKNVLAKLKK